MMRRYLIASLRALPITLFVFALQLILAVPLTLPASVELSRLLPGTWDDVTRAAFLDALVNNQPLLRVLSLQAVLALVAFVVLGPLLHMAWLAALSEPLSPVRALARGARLYGRAVGTTLLIACAALGLSLPWLLVAWLFSAVLDVQTHARAHDVLVGLSLAPLLPSLLIVHTWHDLARARALEHGFLSSVTRSARQAFRLPVLGRSLALGLLGTLLVVMAERWAGALDGTGIVGAAFAAVLVHGSVLGKLWLRSFWLSHTLGYAEAVEGDDTTVFQKGT